MSHDPSTLITPDALAMNGKVVMLNASAKIDAGVANLMRVSLSMIVQQISLYLALKNDRGKKVRHM